MVRAIEPMRELFEPGSVFRFLCGCIRSMRQKILPILRDERCHSCLNVGCCALLPDGFEFGVCDTDQCTASAERPTLSTVDKLLLRKFSPGVRVNYSHDFETKLAQVSCGILKACQQRSI